MLSVVTMLWDANERSQHFSKCYDESWVLKLHAGFKRNLSIPFRFVLFTERPRQLPKEIVQERIEKQPPIDWSVYVEPYRMGVPMILVGLDTVIVGNIDHLADYCMTSNYLALPADPYDIGKACNGVALVPRNHEFIFENWRGENDMQWMRQQRHKSIDLLFPGQVVSYKAHVRGAGLKHARIVYFHGQPKMHEIDDDWIDEHWRV